MGSLDRTPVPAGVFFVFSLEFPFTDVYIKGL